MKINLGCGLDIREGYRNLDRRAHLDKRIEHFNADKYASWRRFLPDSCTEVLANDILEHVEDLGLVLRQIHIALVPRGTLKARVPHFSSPNQHTDPTHQRSFSARTWDFFIRGSGYETLGIFSKITRRRITFHSLYRVFEPFVNLCNFTRDVYEHWLYGWFPAKNIEVTIEK